ncbi:alternative ribosome rescue aminoacyl-tRNA hydrolase ArfB [Oricola cellulosilytica]|uniref:Aminoacyl-tRNA hydrolase n=1 Tax=Oricola cellulosilytica TaxID=1429082 RepID=A0A4R0PDZ8_9HYPH|nr:alternative ribosome rescue aminoacyl-tRNA hydrolase ArfB [Oricola cellulosilytica]TCD16015.1 aminoacyl-tRNA hydrolase [Oricola cellulosilytica]
MSTGDLAIRSGFQLPGWSMTEDFVLARGPGGQSVNKNATAVQLRFFPRSAGVFTDAQFERLIKLAGKRAAKDGSILIQANRFRTQERNREDARDRLRALVAKALEPPPPPRRKTRPTRGSVERRLKAKTVRSGIKRARGKVLDDD